MTLLVTLAVTLGVLSPCWARDFPIYWNIDLVNCKANKVNFDLTPYGILHNNDNNFHGDQVNLWYRPGEWPWITKNGYIRNGAIPMAGNRTTHLAKFLATLDKEMNPDFSGISVLDFEDYGPIWDDYVKDKYKNAARAWVREHYPNIPEDEVEAKTKSEFEASAIELFESLLDAHKSAYPNALTGYYHYPYCNNLRRKNYAECDPRRTRASDKLENTIFEKSSALFPRLYIFKKFGEGYDNYIDTVLEETKRVNKNNVPIYGYFWHKYKDENLENLPKKLAVYVMVKTRKEADGMVMWASPKLLKDKTSCDQFKNHFESFVGPAMKCVREMSDSDVAAMTTAADNKDTIFEKFMAHCSLSA